MTTATVTVANASRDPEVLKDAGRFGLRTLAMELGMFADASYKIAFQGLTAEKQAEAIVAKLHELDGTKAAPKAGGKGKGAAAPTGAAAPPRTPVTTKDKPAAGKDTGTTGDSAGLNATKILEAFNELNANYAALLEQVQAARQEIQTVQSNVSGTNTLVCLSVSLALQMSEQVLNAPPAAVLAAAIEQMGEIQPQLEELVAAQTEEGGGDENEGND